MKVILLGALGQLGRSIQKNFSDSIELIKFTKEELSITDPKYLREVFEIHKPDFVINAAAYTEVDKAEVERSKANETNNKSLLYLVDLSNEFNFVLIHFSTDYVFNGESLLPYTELSKVQPINFYGLTKSLGDKHIIDKCLKFYIFRVSWLYSPYSNNFVTKMIDLSKQDSLTVINDQYGRPTSSIYLSKFLNKLVLKEYQLPFGLYNFSSAGKVISWSGFAEKIFTYALGYKLINSVPKIIKISSKDYNADVLRPSYSVLSNKKLEKKIHTSLQDWEELLINDIKLIE